MQQRELTAIVWKERFMVETEGRIMENNRYPAEKSKLYPLLCAQLRSSSEGERPITVLSNAAALLYDALPQVNWAGFYLVIGTELALGPFQGRPACTRIAKGKGVCGAAWASGSTMVVDDVHEFPGHIACDSASRSEIVLPLHQAGPIMAVLDIDSPITGRFDEQDRKGLEEFADVLELCCDFTHLCRP